MKNNISKSVIITVLSYTAFPICLLNCKHSYGLSFLLWHTVLLFLLLSR